MSDPTEQLAGLFGSVDAARRELRKAAGAMPRGPYRPKDDLVDQAVKEIYLFEASLSDAADKVRTDFLESLGVPTRRRRIMRLRPGEVADILIERANLYRWHCDRGTPDATMFDDSVKFSGDPDLPRVIIPARTNWAPPANASIDELIAAYDEWDVSKLEVVSGPNPDRVTIKPNRNALIARIRRIRDRLIKEGKLPQETPRGSFKRNDD